MSEHLHVPPAPLLLRLLIVNVDDQPLSVLKTRALSLSLSISTWAGEREYLGGIRAVFPITLLLNFPYKYPIFLFTPIIQASSSSYFHFIQIHISSSKNTCAMNSTMFSILLFLPIIVFLFFFLFRKSNTGGKKWTLPPGSLGWPYIGETFQLYSQNPNVFFASKQKRYPSLSLSALLYNIAQ